MSNDTQRILEMLSEGKITVEEAERLLGALGALNGTGSPTQAADPIIETATPEDGEQRGTGDQGATA